MYSQDFPVIPFIPTTWGGVVGQPGQTGVNGTIVDGILEVVAYSGVRKISTPTEAFLFDLAATPSKPLNMTAHWGQRYVQVGYGTPYYSPEHVRSMNATVVTLHQGIPGQINGTLVNPCVLLLETELICHGHTWPEHLAARTSDDVRGHKAASCLQL